MTRLPVNLATHPFEERRARRRLAGVFAAVAITVTLLHGALAWGLQGTAEGPASDGEVLAQLREWGDEVSALGDVADARRARSLAPAVGLSNALIDQRVFPWGPFFSLLEESLPDDVRLEIIQPVTTLDGVRVSLTAVSGSADSLLVFLAALEQRPEFAAVYPGRQTLGFDGALRLSIDAMVHDFFGVPAAAPFSGLRP
jgi:Tfp pilus assembly protein PilN